MWPSEVPTKKIAVSYCVAREHRHRQKTGETKHYSTGNLAPSSPSITTHYSPTLLAFPWPLAMGTAGPPCTSNSSWGFRHQIQRRALEAETLRNTPLPDSASSASPQGSPRPSCRRMSQASPSWTRGFSRRITLRSPKGPRNLSNPPNTKGVLLVGPRGLGPQTS